MSKIRSKNTKVELFFRKILSAEVYPKGLRYRLHYKKIVGNPDIVFVKQKIAVFIDGDFWHGRHYGKKGEGKNWKKFWKDKIETNMSRDRHVNRQLKKESWKVARIWESDVKKKSEKYLAKILEYLGE